MYKSLVTILLAFLVASPALGADAPPTEASVRELLSVTHAKDKLDKALQDSNTKLKFWLKDELKGMHLTPAQGHVIERTRVKIWSLIHNEINWQSVEPLYVDAYQKTYTQREVDALVAFFRSPAGQAFQAKSPALEKRLTGSVKGKLVSLWPKLDELRREMVKQVIELKPKAQSKPD
jgi:hypothetical protein